MTFGGIVLCGGLSSRMGRAKALLPWRGRPLAHHVADVLLAVAGEVVLVTSAELELPAFPAPRVRVVSDRTPGLGPLGGIREGLEALGGDALAFVTGADMPFLSAAFVRRMLSFGAAAAVEIDGFVQSLAAVYPATLATAASALIAERRMRPLFLLEHAGFRKVDIRELPGAESLRACNTPAEYLAALRADGVTGNVRIEFTGSARIQAGAAELECETGLLRDMLARLVLPRGAHAFLHEGLVSARYLVSLNGSEILHSGEVPIAPGEHIIIGDAAGAPRFFSG